MVVVNIIILLSVTRGHKKGKRYQTLRGLNLDPRGRAGWRNMRIFARFISFMLFTVLLSLRTFFEEFLIMREFRGLAPKLCIT